MKNLKKVLALVLVVASLMGLAATASAKDYTDGDKIVNTEAVDVMSATKVIAGMPDGSFNPAGNVTRAQMAKIVSAVLNGGEDIGNMYASANVFSDCTSHWAKSYIAYASNMKIVSGVGNGKFNPEGDVTGVAAAKMFLVALGYDPAIEVYTGKDWVANVMADAKDAGLLKGMPKSFDYSKALSRDNAALMAVNALKATMVEYDTKGTDINIGDTSINVGASKAKAKTTTESWGGAINKDGATGSTASPYAIQLGEQCFDNLKLTSSTDVFGRPAATWNYERKDIGTYAEAATLSYVDSVKSYDLYKDLGKPAFAAASGSVAADTATLYVDGKLDPLDQVANLKNTASPVSYGGKGTITEVFYNSTTNDVVISVINVYLGQVGTYTAAKDDNAAYVNIATGKGSTPGALNNSGKYETKVYNKDHKDTYVLYTAAWNGTNYDVQEAVTAETVRGKLTGYSTSDNSVTVDGKTYKVSAKLPSGDKTYYTGNALKDTVDLYLDTEGNVIGIKQNTAESKDYAVVLGLDVKSSFNKNTFYAQLLLTDGTVKEVNMGTDYTIKSGETSATGYTKFTPTASGAAANLTIDLGDIVTYTDNGDNTMKLVAKNTYLMATNTTLVSTKGGNTITGLKDAAGSAVPNVYGNSNTIYLLHNSVDNKYTAYVGYANVPGLTGKDDVSAANKDTQATYFVDGGVAVVVYVKDAEVSSATNNLIFVSGKSYSMGADSDRGSYTSYQAVVDGKIETIYADGVLAGINGTTGNMYRGYTTNAKGVITSVVATQSGDFTKTTNGIVGANNDVVTIGNETAGKISLAYAKDVKVFYADEDGKLADVGINGISEDTNDEVFYTMKDGVVTNIYIVYVK